MHIHHWYQLEEIAFKVDERESKYFESGECCGGDKSVAVAGHESSPLLLSQQFCFSSAILIATSDDGP